MRYFHLVIVLSGLIQHAYCGLFLTSSIEKAITSTKGGIENVTEKVAHKVNGRIQDAVENRTYFYLYTHEHQSACELSKDDVQALQLSTFSYLRPTKVIIHGLWSNKDSRAVKLLKEAYLYNLDVNVLMVDYSKLAKEYITAIALARSVAEEVAELLETLVTATGVRTESFHLLGHSLGAHVAAFTANHLRDLLGNVSRITGLDPAGPLFSLMSPDDRLDSSDAPLVDVIHSDGKVKGFYDPLGHVDFYLNGGTPVQPGCGRQLEDLNSGCSHGRAVDLYAASLNNTLTAYSCHSMEEVEQKSCSGDETAQLGENVFHSSSRLYYLETTGDYPYVKN